MAFPTAGEGWSAREGMRGSSLNDMTRIGPHSYRTRQEKQGRQGVRGKGGQHTRRGSWRTRTAWIESAEVNLLAVPLGSQFPCCAHSSADPAIATTVAAVVSGRCVMATW